MRELIFFTLHGYPVAADAAEIIEIEGIRSLFLPPLSPGYLAGLTSIDGRTVALAHLAVCCGLSREEKIGDRTVLWIDRSLDFCGFVINDSPQKIKVEQKKIKPLPDYLATPFYRNQVVTDGKIIPLLDLKQIFQNLLKDDLKTRPVLGFETFPPVSSEKLVRFCCAKYQLAAPAHDFFLFESAAEITPLFGQPDFLYGVSQQGNHLVPIISLQVRLDLPQQEKSNILICRTEENGYGLLIDADEQVEVVDSSPALSIPPWMSRPGLDQAIDIDNRLVPQINPAELLASELKLDHRGASIIDEKRLCP